MNFKKKPLAIVDGIPIFCQPLYFERLGEYDSTLIFRHMLLKHRWRDIVSSQPDSVRERLMHPMRTLFLSLIEIPDEGKILDLGAGWGGLSVKLAKHWPKAKIIPYDMNLEGLRILKWISKQEHLNNIKPMCGEILDTPFQNEFFDVILMIGVLEWVPEFNVALSPEETQLKVLQEAHRILKSGGRLLVGVENRFSYRYIKGSPDDHSQLKYTTLMPRALANFYTKIKIKKAYRTYTYSERGYRKLFKKAGFKNIEILGTVKDYVKPYWILTPDSTRLWFELVKDRIKLNYVLKKLTGAIPQRFISFFIPAYFIIGVK